MTGARARLAAAMRHYRTMQTPAVSQATLAELLCVDERTVRRTENGETPVSPRYLESWTAWIRHAPHGGQAAAEEVLALYRGAARTPVAWWPQEWGTLDETGVLPDREETVDRRAFLGIAPLMGGAALPSGPLDVDGYEQTARALRRRYERIPGRELRPHIRTELRMLGYELDDARGETVRRLLVPFTELHLLSAWIELWDMDDHHAAVAHTETAAKAAREAGDDDALAHALSMYGLLAHREGRPRQGVSAVDEACRVVPKKRPASSSYVHVVAAEAHSKVGNERQARANLEVARDAIASLKPTSIWRGPGVWGAHRMRGYEGYALRLLGRHDDAYKTLEGHLGDYAGQPKYRHVHTMDLADTLAGTGEIEGACAWAESAYRDAKALDYGYGLRRVSEFHAKLAGSHGDVQAVRRLGGVLHA